MADIWPSPTDLHQLRDNNRHIRGDCCASRVRDRRKILLVPSSQFHPNMIFPANLLWQDRPSSVVGPFLPRTREQKSPHKWHGKIPHARNGGALGPVNTYKPG